MPYRTISKRGNLLTNEIDSVTVCNVDARASRRLADAIGRRARCGRWVCVAALLIGAARRPRNVGWVRHAVYAATRRASFPNRPPRCPPGADGLVGYAAIKRGEPTLHLLMGQSSERRFHNDFMDRGFLYQLLAKDLSGSLGLISCERRKGPHARRGSIALSGRAPGSLEAPLSSSSCAHRRGSDRGRCRPRRHRSPCRRRAGRGPCRL